MSKPPRLAWIFLALSPAFLGGCATAGAGAGAAVEVPVMFASDRKLVSWNPASDLFGRERGPLTYGTCTVSIPATHKPGEVEQPKEGVFFREKLGAQNHFVVITAKGVSRDEFFNDLRARLAPTGRKQALLFIHGYNVSFKEAAFRTAQIAYDLRFHGVPVFFSWPSIGGEAYYTRDEQNSEWAQPDLQKFLLDFLAQSDAQDVYLIAHSMGNRILARSLAAVVAAHPEARARLRGIILAAPDIDAEVFARDIAPGMAQLGANVTLYVSSKDDALALSEFVHGYPRAGQARGQPLVVSGIDTIDVSNVPSRWPGHSYFNSSTSILGDIAQMINRNAPAANRPNMRPSPDGKYWIYRE